jgi:hypothetical protein
MECFDSLGAVRFAALWVKEGLEKTKGTENGSPYPWSDLLRAEFIEL